jgi:hypothetical protein
MKFMVKTIDTSNGGYETKNHFFEDLSLAIDFANQPVNTNGNSAIVYDSNGRLILDTSHPKLEEVVVEETTVEEPVVEETVVGETPTETPAPKTRRKKTA